MAISLSYVFIGIDAKKITNDQDSRVKKESKLILTKVIHITVVSIGTEIYNE